MYGSTAAAPQTLRKSSVSVGDSVLRTSERSWIRLGAVVAAAFLLVLTGGEAHANAGGDGGGGGAGAGLEGARPEGRSRATWATLLVGYVALGALATGGAYVLRDNIAGRGIAVGAAGWGGLGLGAGAGYALARLHGCEGRDCAVEEDVAIGVGGVLGATAATIVGQFLTAKAGMSRPITTAAGLAPVGLFLTIGLITDW